MAMAIRAKDGDIFKTSILTKVQKMTNEVTLWEEVYRILTVSIASRSAKVIKTLGKGEISVEMLMWPNVPTDPKDVAEMKKNIFSNPAYDGILVSRDGTAALLLTEFKENISYERAFGMLQQLKQKYTDEETEIHIVGFPELMGWIYSYKTQILLVFGISIGLMVVILALIFRNVTGMVAPMAFAVICSTLGIGFIGWMGINFSPLLYVLAFLVGARLISHSVQITCRYFEEYKAQGNNQVQACYETMRVMLMPSLAGVVTDAAGFLILILAKIALMQQVAIIMSFWMMMVGLCGLITPIICSYLPVRGAVEQWSKERVKMTLLDRVCTACARFSLGSGKFIVAGVCIIALAFCVWQSSGLKIGDPTAGSPLLWPDHPYNQAQAFMDGSFDASSENFTLFYEGENKSVYDPVVLNTFEAFDVHMKSALPDIYKSSDSFINIVKMISMTLHDGDELWYQLPNDKDIMYGTIGYSMANVDLYTRLRYVDSDMERAQITIFFADHTSGNLLRIREAAYDFFKDNPMKIADGEFKLAGGRIGMEIAVNEEMKASHVKIDSMVLGAIFVLVALFFRSMVASLMLTLPLILANLVAFTYMALTNIGLSINTLPVAAVGVGVGVDFAIYIYSRCMEEYPHHKDLMDTILVAVRTTGKAVVYTGMTMILPITTWFFISDLKFQAQMGIFLAMIMSTNVILAITLHPLLIYTIQPKFVRRRAMQGNLKNR